METNRIPTGGQPNPEDVLAAHDESYGLGGDEFEECKVVGLRKGGETYIFFYGNSKRDAFDAQVYLDQFAGRQHTAFDFGDSWAVRQKIREELQERRA